MNHIPDNTCQNLNFMIKYRLSWLLLICILGITTDQVSKIWAQNNLAQSYIKKVDETHVEKVFYPMKVVVVIPNLFNFIYKENPAAAFSLTRSIPQWFRRPMLTIISTLAILFFLLWYIRTQNNDGLLLLSFSLVITGAAGNLIDRIRLGYVIDFIDIHAGILGYPHWHWPTFNVADMLIVLGALGIFIRALGQKNHRAQNQT
jgi:signal peptidase II